jgi:hypothetical protein
MHTKGLNIRSKMTKALLSIPIVGTTAEIKREQVNKISLEKRQSVIQKLRENHI